MRKYGIHTKIVLTLIFSNRIESQEEIIESQKEIIDSSLEDSDISRDKTLPTALPYRQTNQLENQEIVPDIEYQDPSTPDESKSPIQSKSESTDTIEICEPQIPR